MQQEQEKRVAVDAETPREMRTRSLQAMVTPSDFEQVRELVYVRRLRSISDWLYELVRRELQASNDRRPAA